MACRICAWSPRKARRSTATSTEISEAGGSRRRIVPPGHLARLRSRLRSRTCSCSAMIPDLLRNNGTAGFGDETKRFPFVAGRALSATRFDLEPDTPGFDLVVSYQDRPGVLYRDRLAGTYEAVNLNELPAGSTNLTARFQSRRTHRSGGAACLAAAEPGGQVRSGERGECGIRRHTLAISMGTAGWRAHTSAKMARCLWITILPPITATGSKSRSPA